MKVLSIGNSFSQDAQRYLHEIAKVNDCDLVCCNLYIGGCSLRTHYLNMLDDERAYAYEYNGQSTGLKVSIREVLKSNEWDIVTLQQASPQSFVPDSYVPYIQELVKFVKKYVPKAKIYLHQTWAYPVERPRLSAVGFETTEEMFQAVQKTYADVREIIKADGMILSGEAMLRAYQIKGEELYRDAIHAGLGFGRYLLALVWFRTLFGERDDFKHMTDFDVPVSKEEQELVYELSRSN